MIGHPRASRELIYAQNSSDLGLLMLNGPPDSSRPKNIAHASGIIVDSISRCLINSDSSSSWIHRNELVASRTMRCAYRCDRQGSSGAQVPVGRVAMLKPVGHRASLLPSVLTGSREDNRVNRLRRTSAIGTSGGAAGHCQGSSKCAYQNEARSFDTLPSPLVNQQLDRISSSMFRSGWCLATVDGRCCAAAPTMLS